MAGSSRCTQYIINGRLIGRQTDSFAVWRLGVKTYSLFSPRRQTDNLTKENQGLIAGAFQREHRRGRFSEGGMCGCKNGAATTPCMTALRYSSLLCCDFGSHGAYFSPYLPAHVLLMSTQALTELTNKSRSNHLNVHVCQAAATAYS